MYVNITKSAHQPGMQAFVGYLFLTHPSETFQKIERAEIERKGNLCS
jgi:23S rRNA maturation mini-RNase III